MDTKQAQKQTSTASKDAPKTVEDKKEDVKKQAQAIVNGEQSTHVDLTPLYAKPLYFIENPTPYLKVIMKQPHFNSKGKHDGYEDVELFTTKDGQNNYLKSFKYDVLGGQEGNVVIELEDTDQSLIEMLTVQLYTFRQKCATYPLLEITYGWSKPNAEDHAIYNKRIIKYTNTISCVFMNMKTKYSPITGVIQATIYATADIKMEHIHGITELPTPFGSLRANPGTTLGVFYLLKQIQQIMDNTKLLSINDGGKTDKAVSTIITNFIYQLCGFLWLENISKDSASYENLIASIFNFYGKTIKQHSDQIASNIRRFYTTVNKDNSKTIGVVSTDNFKTSATININGSKSKINYISMGDALVAMDAEIVKADQNELTSPVFFGNLTEEKLKSILTSDSISDSDINRIRDVIYNVTVIAQDMYIHPLYMIKLVNKYFKTITTTIASVKNNYQFDNITFIEPKRFRPYYVSGQKKQYIAELNGKELVINDIYIPVEDRAKWCIQAKDFSISQNSTWISVYEYLYAKVYADIALKSSNSQEVINQFVSATDKASEIITSTKGADAGFTFIPMPIKCTMRIQTADHALKALNKFMSVYTIKEKSSEGEAKASAKQTKGCISSLITAFNGCSKLACITVLDYSSADAIFSETNYSEHPAFQAFSVGMSGFKNSDNNNIGDPDIWHINFPDVIEFNPEHDLMMAMNNVRINEALTVKVKQSGQVLQKGSDADDAQNSTVQAKITHDASTIDEKLVEKWKESSKVTFNLNFNDSGMYKGGEVDALKYKKDMQNLRQHLIVSTAQVRGSLRFLGDPCFDLDALTQKIFIKGINVDGSLSMLSGMYYITKNISHEITSGSYITTIEDVLKTNDSLMFNALKNDVFNKDKLMIEG